MRCGGVGKLDVLDDIGGPQYYFTGTVGAPGGDAPVAMCRGDNPPVAVLDPFSTGCDAAVVATVTTRSPTPAVWRSATFTPVAATSPAETRSARARRFSSATVAVSGAIMRLTLPASTSVFQAQ
jgi:hypothetical protein